MATLTREAPTRQATASSPLTSSIPSPFPRDLLLHESTENSTSEEEAGPSRTLPALESSSAVAMQELLPSIADVEKTCIMTLNDLLSGKSRWNPIVPDRRHSMPSATASSTPQSEYLSSSALQTLVSNLRGRDPPDIMVEVRGSGEPANLLHELRTRIEEMSHELSPSDSHLAEAIVSLLSHFHRLSAISSSDPNVRQTALEGEAPLYPPGDLFDTLKRQLSDLRSERQTSQSGTVPPNTPPVFAVEKTLLWSRIDEELEAVVAMCKERAEYLPPQYDSPDYEDIDDDEHLPKYEGSEISDLKEKHASVQSSMMTGNEKMRLDFEAVTMAIDRLYLVAPQLHSQRVELKTSKLEQMEKARKQGSAVSRGKQKENDTRDLENMFELIGRASERTLKDQSVILEGGMKSRLERARQRDVAKVRMAPVDLDEAHPTQREAFVEHLADYSDAGRFHQQDAVLNPNPSRMKNPEAMLSLPEFIREAIPDSVRLNDPKALLSLPEFVRENPPPHIMQASAPPASAVRKKPIRHRSLSAPSLSWLRPSSSRSHLRSEISNSNSSPGIPDSEVQFAVHYVAENHENLQRILVFLCVQGLEPGADIEAEVLPAGGETDSGDYLVVKSGPHVSLPLILPGRVSPGRKEVRAQGGHYEIKLATIPASTSDVISAPLLDAMQLAAANPTSYICSSCSSPLVQSSKVNIYKDLPSEHWEELVDAWMCHGDQKLNEKVVKHGKTGFWPEQGQALVGGSYILFDESAINKSNLRLAESPKRVEDWKLARCICGAVVGRCQEHGSQGHNVFRMLKYAIRPISSSIEQSRLPLSAFVVEDMSEFVEAHASYRFIVFDEEDERPRILMWLFKPSMRLAYSTQTLYSMPRSASIRTAKVLFKLLGPSEATLDLKRQVLLDTYPGFPQAEYLFYPMDVCHRLAALLKESNSSYPQSLRVMTGLDVGWLRRA
ncbi:unnamed protein product [Mycena citricolor]|uniref:Uncharacterized protein n=1 Tax=Mycena citricolor TaxID=2018698 RepID=A0AAD2HH40_9AGAR|nr:unnamed protein product [Mycena citricolor]CAK5274700.1 unnamed protein product [Mycena citricolor]